MGKEMEVNGLDLNLEVSPGRKGNRPKNLPEHQKALKKIQDPMKGKNVLLRASIFDPLEDYVRDMRRATGDKSINGNSVIRGLLENLLEQKGYWKP
ncbi:MAG: hypothetical protein JEY71_10425 [Sphaerochaeta sp.]|nr:hypothetical protein [Sphaerochaeta sp.]